MSANAEGSRECDRGRLPSGRWDNGRSCVARATRLLLPLHTLTDYGANHDVLLLALALITASAPADDGPFALYRHAADGSRMELADRRADLEAQTSSLTQDVSQAGIEAPPPNWDAETAARLCYWACTSTATRTLGLSRLVC